MFEIVLTNFGFWLNFSIPVIIGIYLAFFHKEYAWKEFGIQVGVTLAYVLVVYFTLFYTTTDLMDTEYQNSKVSKFEYFEEWTERVTYTESYSCGTTKNPRTCTRTKVRYDYHPPKYLISTTNNETLGISKRSYRAAAKEFGDKKVMLFRSDQSSFGNGNKYVSIPSSIIPVSVAHSYVNYVVASRLNVIKEKQSEENIKQLIKDGSLKQYPGILYDKYGVQTLNRVIDTTGTSVNKKLDEKLNLYSSFLGPSKQANPIIYITNKDRDFTYYLKAYWNNAKKNDVILVLGVDKSGNVEWSDCIAWTNNTDFLVDCSNKFKGMSVKNLEIASKFSELIRTEYKRKPMEEFKYLKENIGLDWYWQALILLINILISGAIFRYFLTNHIR